MFHRIRLPRPQRIHLPFPPIPRMAMVVCGPLSAVSATRTIALIIEAHWAALRTSLVTSEVSIDPSGRTGNFFVFAPEHFAETDARPWCPDMHDLEAELSTIRDHHPNHSLEWAVTIFGQGVGAPEFVRGSYVHEGEHS